MSDLFVPEALPKRRHECANTTDPICHGLDTPTPQISVFRDGCSVLFDFEPVDRDTVVVHAGHYDADHEWVEESADWVVVER